MGVTHFDGIDAVSSFLIGGVAVTATAAEINAMAGAGISAADMALLNSLAVAPSKHIVVSKDGNDTTGVGSFALPYLTLTKAFTVWTAARPLIVVLGGEYEEAATLTWPGVNNLMLLGLGDVSIANGDAAAQVVLVQPGAAATSSFTVSIKGVNLAADTQIALKIANASMVKKLIVSLEDFSAEMDTSGDSIDIAGTVAGQAIRVYGKNLDLEGLLHYTVNDAGSRLRISESALMGGLTGAGAVAAEVTLLGTKVLTGGISVDGAQQLTNVGCVYATDADPAVYTELANAYAT
jgi:hypothetical protein